MQREEFESTGPHAASPGSSEAALAVVTHLLAEDPDELERLNNLTDVGHFL